MLVFYLPLESMCIQGILISLFNLSHLTCDIPGKDSNRFVEPDSRSGVASSGVPMKPLNIDGSSSGSIGKSEVIPTANDLSQKSSVNPGSEGKQIKGALPEGFFDDKEADLRAHGIKLVKPDVK